MLDIIAALTIAGFGILMMHAFLSHNRPTRFMKWLAGMINRAWVKPPKPEPRNLSFDPTPYKAKVKRHREERQAWSRKFRNLAGHPWNEKPEVWDEEADETLLMIECKNHPKNQLCYYCDNSTVRSWQGDVVMKRQRRRK